MIQLVGRDIQFVLLVDDLSDLFETEVVTNDGNTINRWIGNAGGWVGISALSVEFFLQVHFILISLQAQ